MTMLSKRYSRQVRPYHAHGYFVALIGYTGALADCRPSLSSLCSHFVTYMVWLAISRKYHLDDVLTWTTHIESILHKLQRMMGMCYIAYLL